MAEGPEHPNLVFILPDRQRRDTLACRAKAAPMCCAAAQTLKIGTSSSSTTASATAI